MWWMPLSIASSKLFSMYKLFRIFRIFYLILCFFFVYFENKEIPLNSTANYCYYIKSEILQYEFHDLLYGQKRPQITLHMNFFYCLWISGSFVTRQCLDGAHFVCTPSTGGTSNKSLVQTITHRWCLLICFSSLLIVCLILYWYYLQL